MGIAPYEKAAGKLYVGADAHIRPCGYVQHIGRRAGRAQKRPPKAALRLSKKPPAFFDSLSVSINLSCHSEEHPKGTCFAARSDVGIRNLLVANLC